MLFAASLSNLRGYVRRLPNGYRLLGWSAHHLFYVVAWSLTKLLELLLWMLKEMTSQAGKKLKPIGVRLLWPITIVMAIGFLSAVGGPQAVAPWLALGALVWWFNRKKPGKKPQKKEKEKEKEKEKGHH